jgi:DNA invertase Pin-like site-specific DNA recombinase
MREQMRPPPLPRTAYVSVRQASHPPVRDHQESPRRPEACADRAPAWGLGQGVSLDEDGGRRGPGLHERPGLGQRLAAVRQGPVGGVLAWAASRWARHQRAGPPLSARWALTETLRMEDEGG